MIVDPDGFGATNVDLGLLEPVSRWEDIVEVGVEMGAEPEDNAVGP